MTMIVGLLCSDGVVLASETEETAGFTSKRKAYKFARIEDAHWVVIVGAAGDSFVAENAITRLRRSLEKHRNAKLYEETLGDMIDAVLEKVHSTYIDPDPKCEGLALVIGATSDDKCFLVSTHRRAHVFHAAENSYAYSGYGSDLAVYFLDRLHEPEKDCARGVSVAGFVMSEVKETAQFTSGESDFYVLQTPPNPRWRHFGPELTLEFDFNSKIDVGELIREKLDTCELTPSLDCEYSDEFRPEGLTHEEREAMEEQLMQSASQKSKAGEA